MKRCSRCGEEKTIEDFHRSKRSPDGHYAYCKPCAREKGLAWRNANLERARANSRSWANRNVERKRAYDREYYARNPELFNERQRQYQAKWKEQNREKYDQQRRATVLKQYGITLEQYDTLLKRQKGVCWICRQPPALASKQRYAWLCVDHDHASGVVRGLLCQRCNRTLGLYEDDADWFARAARYLRRTT